MVFSVRFRRGQGGGPISEGGGIEGDGRPGLRSFLSLKTLRARRTRIPAEPGWESEAQILRSRAEHG